ncbi:MAG: glycosyltransferase family A protein [Nitrospirota bacterium]|nr:glycosyltransferase family A protein [Nitrospirota bacterium]
MTLSRVPGVSLVVTFFREGALLGETLDSALSQTLQDFEIVLVDNNADLTTRDVVESYAKRDPQRIRIVHEPVQGMCAAKNRGITESRGEYIAFVDGDDLMAPDRLEKQLNVLLSKPEVSLVTCRYDRVSHDLSEVVEHDVLGPTRQSAMWRDLEEAFKDLYRSRFSSERMKDFRLTIPSTFFLRKKILLKVGLFDMRLNPRWCEDYELQTRLFEEGPFFQIPESLIQYRMSDQKAKKVKDGQISGFERFWQDQRFFSILHENFSSRGPAAQNALRKIRSIWLRGVGLYFLEYREGIKIGRTLLRRAIENAPDKWAAWKLYLKTFVPEFLLPRLFWFGKFKEARWISEDHDFGKIFLSEIKNSSDSL